MRKTLKQVLLGLTLVMSVCAAFLCASAAEEHFFEPTQAQYDSSYKEIGAQQAAYVDAKKHSYQKAHDLALFNFQLAWLELNKGDQLLDQKKYAEAMPILAACIEHCKAESICDPKGKHAAQQKYILEHGAQFDFDLCTQMLASK